MLDKEQTRITAEDLMAFGEDEWIEVVDGEIVRTDMSAAGYMHIIVIENFFRILDAYNQEMKLGQIHSDGLTYILDEDADGVRSSRIPDVSFIRRENFKQFDYDRPYPGAPDLAIEVISPTESAETLQSKIASYRAAGTEQVWAVYPASKEVHSYERDDRSTVRVYGAGDSFEAPTLFPGLKIEVAAVFVTERP